MLTFQKIGSHGQFGNQMNQYALLVRVSNATGHQYGVPLRKRASHRMKRFCLPDVFPNLEARDSTDIKPQPRVYKEAPLDNWTYREDVLEVPDGTDFEGYFQAATYVEPIRDRLLREFASKREYRDRAGAFIGGVRSSVAVGDMPLAFLHVRRGDALACPGLAQPGVDYFHRAAAHFPGHQFVMLTDDRPWCQENLGWLRCWRFSPFDDKFDDHELMRQCPAGGIIHNSTFSWWGAWLGPRGRKIVAPRQWSTDRKCEMIPDWWVQE